MSRSSPRMRAPVSFFICQTVVCFRRPPITWADTSRCTVLGTVLGGEAVRVSTVEHLLSACAGLGVADLVVEVDGPEIPIGRRQRRLLGRDVASRWPPDCGAPPTPDFAAADRRQGKGRFLVAAYPADRLTITVAIHFLAPAHRGRRSRVTLPMRGRARRITRARLPERGHLALSKRSKRCLRRGWHVWNPRQCNRRVPDRFSTPLRFADELARHKLLDVIGDLALGGSALLPNADIIAVKPSHRLNAELALRLLRAGDSPSNED